MLRLVPLVALLAMSCHRTPAAPARTNGEPTINVVVFQVGDATLSSSGPTRSDTSIQIAWHDLDADPRAQPSSVAELYSEWEPSASDAAYIAKTFPPSTKVTFSFSRPIDGDWERAMREAKLAIEEAR